MNEGSGASVLHPKHLLCKEVTAEVKGDVTLGVVGKPEGIARPSWLGLRIIHNSARQATHKTGFRKAAGTPQTTRNGF